MQISVCEKEPDVEEAGGGGVGQFDPSVEDQGVHQPYRCGVASRIGAASTVFDIEDLGPSFRRRGASAISIRRRAISSSRLLSADVLVVGSPTFKGSYTGLFKHFFDLLDPSSLRGKPVILAATGGGERHSLIVEHQLRPLFGFFEALTMPTAIYASDKDFADGVLVSEADPRSRPASRRRSMPGGRRPRQRRPCRLNTQRPLLNTASRTAPEGARNDQKSARASRDKSSWAPSCPAADSTSPPGAILTRRPTAPPISSSTSSSR